MRDNNSGVVSRTLDKIAKNENNTFTRHIAKGEFTKACDVAISVLSLVEQRGRSSDSQVSQSVSRGGHFFKPLPIFRQKYAIFLTQF